MGEERWLGEEAGVTVSGQRAIPEQRDPSQRPRWLLPVMNVPAKRATDMEPSG